MKNTFKKISALALVLVMVFALSAAVFAAGDDGRATNQADDVYTGSGNSNAITGTGNRIGETTIPISKSIVFVNANGSNVYEPNITYTYNVTPVTVAPSTITVTDNQPVERFVNSGVTGGVAGVSIPFGTTVGGTDTTAVATSAAGTDIERTANLTVDLSKFERPGIYRYKITETTNPADITSVGLTARTANYDADRYLDVYIKYVYVDHDNDPATPDQAQLAMYGAVIFKTTAATEGQDIIDTSTEKTTGFGPTPTSGVDPKDDETVDRYTTYDITVKKTVSGSLADKLHDFPFYVSISNSITGAKYTFFDDPGTGAGVAETISGAAIAKGTDSASSALKLKDGEYVKFVGVPSNQTTNLSIVVKEFNDTVDEYTPSVSATHGTPALVSTDAMAPTTGSAITTSFDIVSNDGANQILTINNELTEISPTGIVLRVAPYAAILGAGVILLAVSRKYNKKNEEVGEIVEA